MTKQPEECQTIDDIRSEIDHIDEQIVSLIGKRSKYVHAAAKFKKGPADVKADERVENMLSVRTQWAKEQSIDPGFIKNLFSRIIHHFINSEMSDWEREKRE